MARLSVNVNKVATIRNSRGGNVPSVLDAVDVCVDAGAPGITVHPRADERHITRADVRAIAARLRQRAPVVEYNIEGDARADLLALVEEVRPTQCTLVPVTPGEITSQAGWRPGPQRDGLAAVIERLHQNGTRVGVFVDAAPDPIQWAASVGADRVELYTEPFARAFAAGRVQAEQVFAQFSTAARLAHQLGLGVNAGHDLDLANLRLFRTLPFLDEVSIGHAIVARAVFVGLGTVVREYLDVLAAT
jgi:pyridoxine 5-phosphate synthase